MESESEGELVEEGESEEGGSNVWEGLLALPSVAVETCIIEYNYLCKKRVMSPETDVE